MNKIGSNIAVNKEIEDMISSKRVSAAPLDKNMRFSTASKKHAGILSERFTDKLNLSPKFESRLFLEQSNIRFQK